jgi:hypothetical protein
MSESRLKEFLSHGPHDIEGNQELLKEIKNEIKNPSTKGTSISAPGPR